MKQQKETNPFNSKNPDEICTLQEFEKENRRKTREALHYTNIKCSVANHKCEFYVPKGNLYRKISDLPRKSEEYSIDWK